MPKICTKLALSHHRGRAIQGKRPNEIWSIMDELMTAVQVLQPRLYASVLRKL